MAGWLDGGLIGVRVGAGQTLSSRILTVQYGTVNKLACLSCFYFFLKSETMMVKTIFFKRATKHVKDIY